MTTAAAGAGDAGAAGAAGAGAAGAAGAGAAGAAGAGAAGAAGAGAAQTPWHGYTDAADVTYVQNKGWQGPQDVLKSYRDAEKYIGRDPSTLLTMPRADDPAGFMAVMDKLGRPATPDKYEFELPKDADPKAPFLEWARGTFHKLGLPAPVAKDLMKEFNAFSAVQAQAITESYTTSVEADKQQLLKDWGAGHERQMNVAKAAVGALGFTGEMIDAMEQQIGYAGTMKFFADLGMKMSEDTFVTSAGTKRTFDGALLTPDQATAQWNAKTLDQNFMAALKDKTHPGHAAAQAEQTRLFKIRFPEG